MSCDHKNPVVGIIMGSESDMPNMEPCMNAAILAVQMLGTGCDGARQKIIDMKKAMAEA